VHDYDLNDADRFVKVLDLEVPWAHSYADMQPGKTDRERRENYRRAAAGRVESIPAEPLWWAFRIGVQKAGRALDVDNVAKTIIDAFCSWQIVKDQSPLSRSWGCSQTTPSTTCVSSRSSANVVPPTARGSRYSPPSSDRRAVGP
jgi:hypothetical protein